MGRKGVGTKEGGGRRDWGGQRRGGTKKRTLVGDMLEYWGSMRGREPIRFGTYNIRNIRSRGLESALRG